MAEEPWPAVDTVTKNGKQTRLIANPNCQTANNWAKVMVLSNIRTRKPSKQRPHCVDKHCIWLTRLALNTFHRQWETLFMDSGLDQKAGDSYKNIGIYQTLLIKCLWWLLVMRYQMLDFFTVISAGGQSLKKRQPEDGLRKMTIQNWLWKAYLVIYFLNLFSSYCSCCGSLCWWSLHFHKSNEPKERLSSLGEWGHVRRESERKGSKKKSTFTKERKRKKGVVLEKRKERECGYVFAK